MYSKLVRLHVFRFFKPAETTNYSRRITYESPFVKLSNFIRYVLSAWLGEYRCISIRLNHCINPWKPLTLCHKRRSSPLQHIPRNDILTLAQPDITRKVNVIGVNARSPETTVG